MFIRIIFFFLFLSCQQGGRLNLLEPKLFYSFLYLRLPSYFIIAEISKLNCEINLFTSNLSGVQVHELFHALILFITQWNPVDMTTVGRDNRVVGLMTFYNLHQKLYYIFMSILRLSTLASTNVFFLLNS